jgi:hypothetical protein
MAPSIRRPPTTAATRLPDCAVSGENIANALLLDACPDVRLSRAGHDVGLRSRFKLQPEPAAIDVDGVGHHSGSVDAPVQCPRQHPLDQLGLGGKPHRLGNARWLSSRRVVDPLGGQGQLPLEKGLLPLRGIGQKDTHLAGLNPSCRPTVLTRDTDAPGALLEDARLVDNQDPRLVAEVLHHVVAQIVTHRVGVPARPAQQVQYPGGCRVAGFLGQLPAVVALGAGEQAAHLGTGALTQLGTLEVRCQPTVHRVQLVGPGNGAMLIDRW